MTHTTSTCACVMFWNSNLQLKTFVPSIVPSNIRGPCVLFSYLSSEIPNKSALDFMFVIAKYLGSFSSYAENCPYWYTGIMFFAFQPLLCLKLCQHSRCKPTYRCKFDQFYTNNIFVNHYNFFIGYMYYHTLQPSGSS